MYKLLNKFAWLISILFWFFITYFLSYSLGYYYHNFIFLIIPTFIFSIIFKGAFLSEIEIKAAFENMLNKITERQKKEKRNVFQYEENITSNEETNEDKKNIFQYKEQKQSVWLDNNTIWLNSETSLEWQNKQEIIENNDKIWSDSEINSEWHIKPLETPNKTKEFPQISDSIQSEKTVYEYKTFYNKEPSKLISIINDFFSENLMAKIGWILIFLSVLFFLKLAYSLVGNVGKLLMGFIVGFAVIWAWIFLDKKKFTDESRIVLWIWFLINFLVILSWRYLLWDTTNPYLSESITFILLVLNTVFAIITSLVYKSNNLLIFSFIFAYLNPFWVGGWAKHPYTLSIYSMIVSIWALFLSQYFKKENISNILLLGAFGLWNLLFLVAPFSSSSDWIIKLIFTVILSLIVFFLVYKQKKNTLLPILVWIAYLFVLLLTTYGSFSINHIFENTFTLIWLLAWLTIFTILSVFTVLASWLQIALFLLIGPIIIISILLLNWNLLLFPYASSYILLLFVFAFAFISWKAVWIFKYILWIVFAVLFTLLSWIISFKHIETTQWIVLILSMLIFMIASYFFSTKKNLQILYVIWSIFTAFMLSLIMKIKWDLMSISIFATAFYTIANIILPIISKNLVKWKTSNLAFGIVAWLIFISFTIYRFGNFYFPGIALGFAFLSLAMLYFIVSYLMYIKLKPELKQKENKLQAQNAIFAVLAWTISLLSIAVSYIFSKHWEVIATTWLLEWVILLYFFWRTENKNIYIWSMILFVISIVKLQYSVDYIHKWDFISLIPLLLIITITTISAKFMENKDNTKELFYDIIHLIIIFLSGFSISNIFVYYHHWFGILIWSILTALLVF